MLGLLLYWIYVKLIISLRLIRTVLKNTPLIFFIAYKNSEVVRYKKNKYVDREKVLTEEKTWANKPEKNGSTLKLLTFKEKY